MIDNKVMLQTLAQAAGAVSDNDANRFFDVLYRANEILDLRNTAMADSMKISHNQLDLWLRGEESVPGALRSTVLHWIEREATRRLRMLGD